MDQAYQAKWEAEVDSMIGEFKAQIAANPDTVLFVTVACRHCGIALRVPAEDVEEARTGLLAHPPLCPLPQLLAH